MLQQANCQKNEQKIERGLDRLQFFLSYPNLRDALPAFFYCADLLDKYSKTISRNLTKAEYFQTFTDKVNRLLTYQLPFKTHQKQILDEILQIVGSQSFKSSKISKRIKQPIREDERQAHISSQRIIQAQIMVQQRNKIKQINLRQLFQKLEFSYKQHRIDQAYSLMKLYRQATNSVTQDQQAFFSLIQEQYVTMIQFYKQFDLQGWVFDKQENGVTLQYKIFEKQKQIAIRIASEFDIRVDSFLAILTEMDLTSTYIPFAYDSKQLKVLNRNKKIGTSKIYIPLLTDRQTYFYAVGYDRINTNGSIFIYSKTINEDKQSQNKYGFKVPSESDFVRLEYNFFIVEYIPINRERAKVRLASKVDMKLDFLPQFILNMSARKFAFDYFKNIIKVNRNFKGSAWERKIKENQQYYDFFRKKIDQYIAQGRI